MRFTIPLILMVVFLLMFVGQQINEGDIDNDKIRNIKNFTETNLVWNFTTQAEDNINISEDTDWELLRAKRISRVIYKFVDFVGFSFMELGKFFVEFGYNNPQYDFELFISLIKWYFIILILAIISPLLIPLIAIIYLIVVGCKNLYNKYIKKTK